jgi:hypothetical protein
MKDILKGGENEHRLAIELADHNLDKLNAINEEINKKETSEGLSPKESKLHQARKKLYEKSKDELDNIKNGNGNINNQPLNFNKITSDIPGASVVSDSFKLAKNTINSALDEGEQLITGIGEQTLSQLETLLTDSLETKDPETIKDDIVDAGRMFPLTTEHLAKKIGIDLLRPEKAAHQIAEVNKTLDNPAVQQQLKEGVGAYSKVAAATLDSTKPVMDEVIDIYANTAQEIGDEMGETAVKVGLNTIQSIPGVGAAVGVARDAGNIADAIYNTSQINSISNTLIGQALETSDSALKEKLQAIKEYEKKTTDLFDEKENIEGRTQKSIDNHMSNSNNTNNNKQTGGNKKPKTKRRRKFKLTRKNKWRSNKSKRKKRVRFSFKRY